MKEFSVQKCPQNPEGALSTTPDSSHRSIQRSQLQAFQNFSSKMTLVTIETWLTHGWTRQLLNDLGFEHICDGVINVREITSATMTSYESISWWPSTIGSYPIYCVFHCIDPFKTLDVFSFSGSSRESASIVSQGRNTLTHWFGGITSNQCNLHWSPDPTPSFLVASILGWVFLWATNTTSKIRKEFPKKVKLYCSNQKFFYFLNRWSVVT